MMDELYKALETIRKECIKHTSCDQCPLRRYQKNLCGINESSPAFWKIEEPGIPRLFK